MLYLDRLSRPKVSRNATTPGFWLPSNGHLLEIMPIQGLSFTTFKENVPIFSLKHKINEFSLNFWRLFCIQRILKYPWIQMNTDWSWLVTHVQYLYTIYPAVENIAYTRFQLISVTLISLISFLNAILWPPRPPWRVAYNFCKTLVKNFSINKILIWIFFEYKYCFK